MSELPNQTNEGVSDAQDDIDASEQKLSGVTMEEDFWKSLLDGLAQLERRVGEAHAETPAETLLELRNCVLVLQQRSAELKGRVDQVFIDAIDAHGPIIVGSLQYVVSIARSTTCRDRKTVAEGLLDAVAGDIERFCGHLVAQPFKPASARSILPSEIFDRCFETTERRGVDEEPVRKLTKLDLAFVSRKRGSG